MSDFWCVLIFVAFLAVIGFGIWGASVADRMIFPRPAVDCSWPGAPIL